MKACEVRGLSLDTHSAGDQGDWSGAAWSSTETLQILPRRGDYRKFVGTPPRQLGKTGSPTGPLADQEATGCRYHGR